MNGPGVLKGRRHPRPVRLASLGLVTLVSGAFSNSVLAYWEVIPKVEAGLTWEDNPRYISDAEKAIAEAIAPGISDDVTGTFIDTRLDGIYRTPANEIRLSPRIRKTNYLKSNKDLNDDDWNINLSATHEDRRGSIGVAASYGETDVRTGEFESATPENPNAPPETSGGSGRYAGDDTQTTRNLRPFLEYQLSQRNTLDLSFSSADVEYDEAERPGDLPGFNGYFDYTYKQTQLGLSHYLNDKNFLQVSLNGGGFDAEQPGGAYRNSTESYGVSAAYTLAITPTLTANANAGVSRSSVDIVGLPFDPLTGAFCPPNALCSASDDDRNFVGDIGLRKRSELTTLNFNVSRSLAPRSNGTEVVLDNFRFFVDRTMTQRLSVSAGSIYSKESAVASESSRFERTYFTIDTTVSWRLTSTLSAYGKYTYISSENDAAANNFEDTNHRLYFGISYSGVGIRR